jgi:hypothetical protein
MERKWKVKWTVEARKSEKQLVLWEPSWEDRYIPCPDLQHCDKWDRLDKTVCSGAYTHPIRFSCKVPVPVPASPLVGDDRPFLDRMDLETFYKERLGWCQAPKEEGSEQLETHLNKVGGEMVDAAAVNGMSVEIDAALVAAFEAALTAMLCSTCVCAADIWAPLGLQIKPAFQLLCEETLALRELCILN